MKYVVYLSFDPQGAELFESFEKAQARFLQLKKVLLNPETVVLSQLVSTDW